jgi:hypothetical protein
MALSLYSSQFKSSHVYRRKISSSICVSPIKRKSQCRAMATLGWFKNIKVGNSILHKAALVPYAISDLFAKFEQNSIIFTGAKFLQDFN